MPMLTLLLLPCLCSADNGALSVSSAAVDPVTKKLSITGTVTAPMDVVAGGGMVHNVNALMLPTTNMTRLMQITNCTM